MKRGIQNISVALTDARVRHDNGRLVARVNSGVLPIKRLSLGAKPEVAQPPQERLEARIAIRIRASARDSKSASGEAAARRR